MLCISESYRQLGLDGMSKPPCVTSHRGVDPGLTHDTAMFFGVVAPMRLLAIFSQPGEGRWLRTQSGRVNEDERYMHEALAVPVSAWKPAKCRSERWSWSTARSSPPHTPRRTQRDDSWSTPT